MRIKAVANGNVIEAHEDAARQLIEAGIYVDAKDEPITASLTPPVPPANNSTQPPKVETKPTKKRKAR